MDFKCVLQFHRDERVGDDPAATRCPVVGEVDSDEEEPFANGGGGAAGGDEYWRENRGLVCSHTTNYK